MVPRAPGAGAAASGEGLGQGAPRRGREEREGREELNTGSTDGSNRSPGSTLGQGERWKRGREVTFRGKESGGGEGARMGERAGAPGPHAQGRADFPLLDPVCF
jgi:hypothetical protein